MLGISLIVGLLGGGIGFFDMMYLRIFEAMQNYILVAIILFIFMGLMLDKSGMGDKLFRSAHIVLGRLPGGLALSVVAVCTVMAAATGIIGAPVIIMGMVALPVMLSRGYDKSLSCGVISAGGCLGILIPPSIMLVVYGPMASLSVGKLFMAALFPGLLLSALYTLYVVIVCSINPKLGPPLPAEEQSLPLAKKVSLLASSMLPPLLLIGAVLGSMFFGVASPTEASALGAVASLVLALVSKKLNWKGFKESVYETLRSSSMILLIVAAAFVFTGTFMMVGGGEMVQGFLLDLPIGRWGILLVMCLAFYVCGFFMEWPGILPILVPIFTPIVKNLGFDPIWAATVFCVTMQTSFLTPPMAPALFYLKGVAPKEINFLRHICGGALPFMGLQLLGLAILLMFPQLSLWLVNVMVK
jgi:tripartite ATP-independent transporter DctM subunit